MPSDFLTLMKLGAVELELQLLASGGVPSRGDAHEQHSRSELARRAMFLVGVGERVLQRHQSHTLVVRP